MIPDKFVTFSTVTNLFYFKCLWWTFVSVSQAIIDARSGYLSMVMTKYRRDTEAGRIRPRLIPQYP